MLRNSLITRLLRHQYQSTKLVNYARPTVNQSFRRPVVTTREQGPEAIEDGYVKKFMNAMGLMDKNRTRLKLAGYFLYESIPDQVNYIEWFEKCNLSDTFTSWFNITELHVWLLMVRCMGEDISEGPNKKYVKGDGHFIRNCIIEAMWGDVSNRIKFLEGANPAIAKKQVSELSEQFQAALVSYDEGLSCDRALAAAVWRRFYHMAPDTDAASVETILKFIRHQLSLLDKIRSEELRTRSKMTWLSIGDNN